MRRPVALALLLLAAGCDDDTATTDAAVLDLAVPVFDFAAHDLRGVGRIGDPCTRDSDCGDGIAPFCFVGAVAGLPAAKTPGGYCSSRCGQSDDCECMWFGFLPEPMCFRRCNAPSDCRSGYSCLTWMSQVCFPTAPVLDCDPTSGDGSCTTVDSKPGGCYRLAIGDGLVGRCGARCDLYPGQCGRDAYGIAQRCTIADDRADVDGGFGGGNWIGSVCDLLQLQPSPGGSCAYVWATPLRNYDSLCADGYACAADIDPFGDEDCRQECWLPGGAPSIDGGTPPSCSPGDVCQDVYGLGDNADPSRRVGLCPSL